MAAFHGVPFRRPVPDPIQQDLATLTIAPEQPLAVRLGRLGIAATKRGHGLTFCREVSNLLWSGEVDNWHEGAHLAGPADSASEIFVTVSLIVAALRRTDACLLPAAALFLASLGFRGC